MAFFYLVTTGWILTYEVILIALSENFIGQSRYDTPFDIIEQRFRVLSQIIKFAAVKSITYLYGSSQLLCVSSLVNTYDFVLQIAQSKYFAHFLYFAPKRFFTLEWTYLF